MSRPSFSSDLYVLIRHDCMQLILAFCGPKELGCCANSCKTVALEVQKISIALCHYVQKTYYSNNSLILPEKLNAQYLHLIITRRVVIIRGFLTFLLDVKQGEMVRKADTRRDRGHFSAVVFKGEVYAIGTLSLIAAGTVEKYNPLSNSWANVESLPKKLQSVASAVLNDQLFVIGGFDTTTEHNSDLIYIFDPSNFKHAGTKTMPCWECRIPGMLMARAKHCAIGFREKLWVAGGCLEGGVPTNSVEIYDPLSNQWEMSSPMLRNRVFGHLLLADSKLYAVGGDVDDDGNQVTRSIERFDDEARCWLFVAHFKDDRRGFSASAVGSKIYVFGGSTVGETYNDTWDTFDTVALQWESDSNMSGYGKMPAIEDWGQAVTIPHSHITWR